MSNLSELIKKLEAAPEGNRYLDAEIAMAVGGYSAWQSKHGYWNVSGPAWSATVAGRRPDEKYDSATGKRLPPPTLPEDWVWDSDVPEWTTSIDAAVAFIANKHPGATWSVTQLAASFEASIEEHEGRFLISGDLEVYATAKTAPLALCAALLTALQAQGEKTP